MKKWFRALIATLVVAGVAFYFEYRSAPPALAKEIQNILRAPDSVKASRTLGWLNAGNSTTAHQSTTSFYEKETNSVPVPPETAKRVQEIISSKTRQSEHSKCLYTPGLAMTFTRGTQEVDLFFCFECNAILMKRPGSPDIDDLGPMAKFQNELLGIFKKLFPGEPAFEKLQTQLGEVP